MKTFRLLEDRLLTAGLALGLAGCGGGGTSAPATTSDSSTATEKFKVALVTPGDVNDQGWNQLAYDGLKGLEKDGAQISHQVTKSPADQQPALRDFADQ